MLHVILCRTYLSHQAIQMTEHHSLGSMLYSSYFAPVWKQNLALKQSEKSREVISTSPVYGGSVLSTLHVHRLGVGQLIPRHSYFVPIAATLEQVTSSTHSGPRPN